MTVGVKGMSLGDDTIWNNAELLIFALAFPPPVSNDLCLIPTTGAPQCWMHYQQKINKK